MCRECTPGGPEDYHTTTPEDAGRFERRTSRAGHADDDVWRPSSRSDLARQPDTNEGEQR